MRRKDTGDLSFKKTVILYFTLYSRHDFHMKISLKCVCSHRVATDTQNIDDCKIIQCKINIKIFYQSFIQNNLSIIRGYRKVKGYRENLKFIKFNRNTLMRCIAQKMHRLMEGDVFVLLLFLSNLIIDNKHLFEFTLFTFANLGSVQRFFKVGSKAKQL